MSKLTQIVEPPAKMICDMLHFIVFDLKVLATYEGDLDKALWIMEEEELKRDRARKKRRYLVLSAPFKSLGDVHDVQSSLKLGKLSTFFADSDAADNLYRRILRDKEEGMRIAEAAARDHYEETLKKLRKSGRAPLTRLTQ